MAVVLPIPLFRAMRLAAGLLAALVAVAVPAQAQFGATNASRVADLQLPRIERDGLVLSYSPAAKDEAEFYATEAAAAVAWYHRTLPWKGSIAMAVLDPAGFRLATSIAYPSPHAETLTGFVIIVDVPQFEAWMGGHVIGDDDEAGQGFGMRGRIRD